jgi:F-type H+-transporting ATPase subunit delta
MNQGKIPVRYAQAIFDLAVESNQLEDVYSNFVLLEQVIEVCPELMVVITGPSLTNAQRSELLGKALGETPNQLSQSFLAMLVKQRREAYLRAIIRDFKQLYRNNKGIREVNITTAIPVNEQLAAKIKTQIENKLQSTIEVQSTVNPAIIGGLIIQVDDLQFDGSVVAGLSRIKKELLSTHV